MQMQQETLNRQNYLSIGKYFYTVLSLFVVLLFFQFFFNENIGDDAKDIPMDISTVRLPAYTPPVSSQLISPDAPLYHAQLTMKNGDTLTSILIEAKVDSEDILDILALPAVQNSLTLLTPGKTIFFTVNEEGNIQSFRYKISPTEILSLSRSKDKGFTSHVEKLQPTTHIKTTEGTIHGSLFGAAHAANLSDKMMLQLVNIFAPDINFSSGIRSGDRFKVLYETHTADNETVGEDEILAAEFTSQGKTYKAIRFKTGKNTYGYFDPNGNSLKRAFIRTPVNFTRVSSSFNPSRIHPILRYKRPHLGVDLAAPRGTPVRASSNAVVEFAGREGGYGNLVILNNGQGITTRYGHLSRFATGLRKGMRVREGQVIAYVGSTGLATGPHLHYEFRIDDIPQNPLTVNLPYASSVPYTEKRKFKSTAKVALAQMDAPPLRQYANSTYVPDPNEDA